MAWQRAEQLGSLPPVQTTGPSASEWMARALAEAAEQQPTGLDLRPLEAPPPAPDRPVRGLGERVVLATCGLATGGAERQTLALARELDKLGYQVVVANAGPPAPGDPLAGTSIGYDEEATAEDLRSAGAVIWWGTALQLWDGLEGLPQSIHVVHSCSRATADMLARTAPWLTSGRVVGVSGPAAQLAEHVLGRPADVIWNGIDPSGLASPRPGTPDCFVLGFLGRYASEKNLIAAVAALQLLPQHVRLRLFGWGPMRGPVLEAARELAVDHRVDLCGVAEPAHALAQFDALLLPSTFEGFPLVTVEAALAGVPVVCTPCGDLPLVFREGQRGLLCKPDPYSIAGAVQRLVDWPHLARWLADNARAFARRHLTAERMGWAYSALIQEVAHG